MAIKFKVLVTFLSIVILIAVVYGIARYNVRLEKANPTGVNAVANNAQSSAGSATGAGTATRTRYWIMSSKVLDEMSNYVQAKEALINDTIYVNYNATSYLSASTVGLNIIKTAYFASEASLSEAILNNQLPAGVKAVLYDNEKWSETPVNEQANPVLYYQKAFTLAHGRGLTLIATPGSSSLVPQIAQYADIVDIQAQESQSSVSEYDSKVLPIVSAIKAVDPTVIILSGLSTNPHAGIPSPAQLVSDAKSVLGNVQGFWLNIPDKPVGCTASDTGGRCLGPQPQIGQQFLAQLGAN